MSDPTTPKGLGAAGVELWGSIAGKYELRPDEFAVLGIACKTADRIAELEKARVDAGLPFLSRGSMGQEVIHPLIAELRAHEAHLSTQLAKLKLPDESGTKPNQQRDAAQSRWAQAHGKGA